MKGKWKFMVAALCVLVFVVMAVASTGGDDDKPKKEGGNTVGNTSTAAGDEELKFGLNETAAFKDLKITANEIKTSQGSEFNKPAEGKIFVGVKITIENISNEEKSISSLLLFDAYADDVKCEYSVSANMAFNEGTLDGPLSPGKKMVGYYAVEVSKDAKKLDLEIKSDWLSSSKARFELDIPQ